MSCKFYQHYETGELSGDEFEKHLENCALCRRLVKDDQELLALAGTLEQEFRAPLLWGKIENSLREEKRQARKSATSFLRNTPLLLRLAAGIMIILGISSVLYFNRTTSAIEPNILSQKKLEKVETLEKQHFEAIEALADDVENRFSQMDIELVLLYQDRLQTIDAQIQRCKEALMENPANAHIRQYMLAALQDKRETLQEILTYNNKS